MEALTEFLPKKNNTADKIDKPISNEHKTNVPRLFTFILSSSPWDALDLDYQRIILSGYML